MLAIIEAVKAILNQQIPPLPVSANRWTRPGEPRSETERALRKARSILNKITLRRFEPLSEQLAEIGLATPDILQGVAFLVFEKALLEPKFSSIYAKLCKELSLKPVEFPAPPDGDKPITFRRVLVNKCQEEFEENMAKTRKKTVPAGLDAAQMAEWEDQETRARKKMLGNIKFVGELFKEGMLTERIMNNCIVKLLGDADQPLEDDMEALTKLLTTIGSKLDHDRCGEHVEECFGAIKALSSHQALSARIRFGLRNLIELRGNGWVPRRHSRAL